MKYVIYFTPILISCVPRRARAIARFKQPSLGIYEMDDSSMHLAFFTEGMFSGASE